MTPIEFKASVVEVTQDDRISIALSDGTETGNAPVAILSCDREAATALRQNLSSALNAG